MTAPARRGPAHQFATTLGADWMKVLRGLADLRSRWNLASSKPVRPSAQQEHDLIRISAIAPWRRVRQHRPRIPTVLFPGPGQHMPLAVTLIRGPKNAAGQRQIPSVAFRPRLSHFGPCLSQKGPRHAAPLSLCSYQCPVRQQLEYSLEAWKRPVALSANAANSQTPHFNREPEFGPCSPFGQELDSAIFARLARLPLARSLAHHFGVTPPAERMCNRRTGHDAPSACLGQRILRPSQ
jgi:hypothetical protein